MVLDSVRPSLPFSRFAYSEVRFNLLPRTDEKRAKDLLACREQEIRERWAYLEELAAR